MLFGPLADRETVGRLPLPGDWYIANTPILPDVGDVTDGWNASD